MSDQLWLEIGDDKATGMAADDPRRYIAGGRRNAVGYCPWMGDATPGSGWWVGTSPRNGDGASIEGPWEDWVELARNILAAHEKAVALGYAAEVPPATPEGSEQR